MCIFLHVRYSGVSLLSTELPCVLVRSLLQHPQDRVPPLFNAQPHTTFIFPHSHLHSHLACPLWASDSLLITKSRKNFLPTKSSVFTKDGVESLTASGGGVSSIMISVSGDSTHCRRSPRCRGRPGTDSCNRGGRVSVRGSPVQCRSAGGCGYGHSKPFSSSVIFFASWLLNSAGHS